MTVTAARDAVSAAALAGDRVALVALGASLPATTAFAYERHRARAYAHALEDSGDAALGELAVGAAAMPPSAAVLAADGAGLHLLLGDPARSIAAIGLAARTDLPFDDFGRAVLLASTRAAPGEWRRAARAAALVRHPRAALVALAAAFNAMGDRGAYRVALATTGLLTALVALLALPTLLVDGGTSVAGVTAPSFAAPPSVVVVPNRPEPPQQPPQNPIDAIPPFVGSTATLVSSPAAQPVSVSSRAAGPSARGAPRARAWPRSPSGAFAPVRADSAAEPTPSPLRSPAPQPEPPTVSLAVAPAAAPAAARGPCPTSARARGRRRATRRQAAKAARRRSAAAGHRPPAHPPAARGRQGEGQGEEQAAAGRASAALRRLSPRQPHRGAAAGEHGAAGQAKDDKDKKDKNK